MLSSLAFGTILYLGSLLSYSHVHFREINVHRPRSTVKLCPISKKFGITGISSVRSLISVTLFRILTAVLNLWLLKLRWSSRLYIQRFEPKPIKIGWVWPRLKVNTYTKGVIWIWVRGWENCCGHQRTNYTLIECRYW